MTSDLDGFGIASDAELDDAALAMHLARTTGDILSHVRRGRMLHGSELGNAGDEIAEAWISRVLRNYRPDDHVLSEEAEDDLSRLGKHRVWIIDPLDGTREYSGKRADWAVHIALSVDGKITEAAVGVPGLDYVYGSKQLRAQVPLDFGPLTNQLVISQNSTPRIAMDVAQDLGMDVTRLGSCGAKAASVIRGENDAYIHAGGQYEWDNAAPVGVALAAGLHCSRLDGSELVYNQQDTLLPDLLICREEVADKILASIQKFL